MKPDGVVLPLLNGIETPDRLAALLGRRRVLKGLARIVSHISAPGCITHVGVEPTILFKERDNATSDRTMAILDLLAGAGIRARLPDDMDVALWEKFLFVTSVGGVGALSRAPLGVLREMPETRSLLQEAMAEVAVLARAQGTTLRPDAVARAMEFLDGMPADASASLQRDIMAGRRSELEAWSGAIVRLGRQAGVSTPVHEVIYRSLLPLEQRAGGAVSFT